MVAQKAPKAPRSDTRGHRPQSMPVRMRSARRGQNGAGRGMPKGWRQRASQFGLGAGFGSGFTGLGFGGSGGRGGTGGSAFGSCSMFVSSFRRAS
jgi:hypothetical protein